MEVSKFTATAVSAVLFVCTRIVLPLASGLWISVSLALPSWLFFIFAAVWAVAPALGAPFWLWALFSIEIGNAATLSSLMLAAGFFYMVNQPILTSSHILPLLLLYLVTSRPYSVSSYPVWEISLPNQGWVRHSRRDTIRYRIKELELHIEDSERTLSSPNTYDWVKAQIRGSLYECQAAISILRDYSSCLDGFDEDPFLNDRDRDRFRHAESELSKELYKIGHLYRMLKRAGAFPFESVKPEHISNRIDQHIARADSWMEKIGSVYANAKNQYE